ncbi:MAG TPA: SpoIIE family protein phosphatase [Chitinivibrionales bacterium]|jgi:anti-sigma regulatory factor (Ser/Thr protein kinase)|nr:SpoIIE family protein phosphatase [Chitinivibrionales bacterium]
MKKTTRKSPIPPFARDASRTASALQAREELSIARGIQTAMVPKRLPAVEGIEMASLYLPSDRLGGDLFDVIQKSDDVLVITIFDVASSGVPAALLASLAKVSFANNIREVSSPRAVMERVNREMMGSVSARYYITALVAYLDLHDNRLTYCNAAHPYPIIVRTGSGAVEPIKSTGVCMGLFETGQFEERSLYLNSGDWLLFFTDGLYSLFPGENALASRRLLEREAAASAHDGSPGQFVKRLRRRCTAAARGAVRDDVTVLSIVFLAQSRKNLIKEKLGFMQNDPVYLQFISYFEEMDKATSVILSSMDSLGYPDESIRKMKIILTELFANAIYHGNKGDHSKKVTVGHAIDTKKVTISIMDEGDGFDPSKVPDPTLPENLVKDCGRGIYIVRNYADKLEFNEKGNRVTITKYHVTK